ncbi:MAG: sialate O-acetylesterase, partial [Opitutaceae bacterium]
MRIASFVWIQGESDATRDYAPHYQERLQAIIDDFRVHVADDPKLPVLLGVDEQHIYVKQSPSIVTAQEIIAHSNARCRRTSMIGL